ncbi:FOXR1 isoform 2 [Pongo abelii]|uniref:FOXR1 isoform 2 n=1 Tax=Pongo abelii TaxID=9601 RepID=A0A2J8X0T4_PONAB|nr:FOXR1 isoform 2 [Pongo abelii]
MGNELFLAFTTTHLPLAEQKLARYKLRIVKPPKLPLEKKPNPDKDGPDYEPNLWMWVNPNIVYPPGKLEVPGPRKREDLISTLPSSQPPQKEEDASCSEATGVESLSQSSSKQSPPRKRFAFSPSTWEGPPPESEASASQQPGGEALVPAPSQLLPPNCPGFKKQFPLWPQRATDLQFHSELLGLILLCSCCGPSPGPSEGGRVQL